LFIGFQQADDYGQQQQQLDNLTCSYCYKVFREPGGLRVHVRDLHEAAENVRHACSLCHKLFKSINTLRNHKSLYHKGQK
jgi:ribosomal protein L34E